MVATGWMAGIMPKHGRDSVHLDLRVAVIHHAVSLAYGFGLLELGEDRIKIGVVVVGQIYAVGVLFQIVAEEAEAVVKGFGIGHLVAFVHVVDNGIYIHLLFLVFFGAVVGKRGETQIVAADGQALCGEEIPSGNEDGYDGNDEE